MVFFLCRGHGLLAVNLSYITITCNLSVPRSTVAQCGQMCIVFNAVIWGQFSAFSCSSKLLQWALLINRAAHKNDFYEALSCQELIAIWNGWWTRHRHWTNEWYSQLFPVAAVSRHHLICLLNSGIMIWTGAYILIQLPIVMWNRANGLGRQHIETLELKHGMLVLTRP